MPESNLSLIEDMMKPHCDYCGAELKGFKDPTFVPCNECQKLLKETLEMGEKLNFMTAGEFKLFFPKHFFQKAVMDEKTGYVFRSLLKKLRGFSAKFVEGSENYKSNVGVILTK